MLPLGGCPFPRRKFGTSTPSFFRHAWTFGSERRDSSTFSGNPSSVSEVMPKLAQVLDKTTLIRSVSYTPAGLFNHTAAIYQMLTGYTADKVSPSGQLEPPSPKDFY